MLEDEFGDIIRKARTVKAGSTGGARESECKPPPWRPTSD